MTPLIPPGAQVCFLDSPWGRLRLLHAGAPVPGRLPAVLLHGGGSDNSAISWYRVFEPLGRDRQVWAVDLPGFGGSVEVPPVGGPEAMVEVVSWVMNEVGAARAVVFGVSMGGDVALNLALAQPDRVAGLVLVAPGGLVPMIRNRAVQRAAWLASRLPDRILIPLARLANRFVDRALRAIVADPATLPHQVVAEFAREARHPCGASGYMRYNQATLGPTRMVNDLTDRVHEIGVRTLFFHGADDPMVDPDGSWRAAQRMEAARLVLVPQCGHWAQLEQHELFLAEAKELLTVAEEDARSDGSA